MASPPLLQFVTPIPLLLFFLFHSRATTTLTAQARPHSLLRPAPPLSSPPCRRPTHSEPPFSSLAPAMTSTHHSHMTSLSFSLQATHGIPSPMTDLESRTESHSYP
ncbi:hypothetical protein OIU74_000750 [Salix koriyanagi]|uniref:Uncharacterized protein n=1 Tax=Salix koriyanagi TaxID=2511006 RepID=A0A9Q1AMP4_9ROSI|nr:hypothetical protein OIU74_000750 [Salix koriyanagi]